jgi:protein-L-isoaspartate O-methyltransferase
MIKDTQKQQNGSQSFGQIRPYVDYYNANNVIPVGQDLTDLDSFVFRRNYLYTRLGVPLHQFNRRSVLEFGPGGGFNAVATSIHEPELYVFVDAVQASLAGLAEKNRINQFRAKNIEIVESDIFDYRDERKFDYVICEGVIPCQVEPERMLRQVSGFVNEGGILITTTMSAASILSEICRRLLRVQISKVAKDFESRVRFASRIFDSHLKVLGASTRTPDHWVIDNIFHDWHNAKYLFDLLETAEVLRGEFDFYQSSPCFLTDDRWYKQVVRGSQRSNDLLVQQYPAMASSLIDYRLSLTTVMRIGGDLSFVEELSRLACAAHENIIESNSYDGLQDFFRIILELRGYLPVEFSQTASAIDDFVKSLREFIDDSGKVTFHQFKNWWGRGQQYASFIRAS